jgi:HAAS
MTTIRTELLIARLDRRLRNDVPYRRRRAIRRELRANLADAAQRVGEREAIRKLGDIDDLAAEYRSVAGRGEMPFRPDSGVRALLCTTLALLIVDLIRIPTFNMVTTFDAHTGQQQWEWGIRYLCRFGGDIHTHTLFVADLYWTSFVLFGLAAFLIWSRAWRLAVHIDRTRNPLSAE